MTAAAPSAAARPRRRPRRPAQVADRRRPRRCRLLRRSLRHPHRAARAAQRRQRRRRRRGDRRRARCHRALQRRTRWRRLLRLLRREVGQGPHPRRPGDRARGRCGATRSSTPRADRRALRLHRRSSSPAASRSACPARPSPGSVRSTAGAPARLATVAAARRPAGPARLRGRPDLPPADRRQRGAVRRDPAHPEAVPAGWRAARRRLEVPQPRPGAHLPTARRRRAWPRSTAARSPDRSSTPCAVRRRPPAPTCRCRAGYMRRGDLARYDVVDRRPTQSRYRGYDVYGMAPSVQRRHRGRRGAQHPRAVQPRRDDRRRRAAPLPRGELAGVRRPRRVRRRPGLRQGAAAAPAQRQVRPRAGLPRSTPTTRHRKPVAAGDVSTYDGRAAAPGRAARRPTTTRASRPPTSPSPTGGATSSSTPSPSSRPVAPASWCRTAGSSSTTSSPTSRSSTTATTRTGSSRGKRPRSSMSPTIVLRNGKPFLALGSPGGSTIITTVLQMLVNRIDLDMTIKQAMAAPRVSPRNANPMQAEQAFRDRLRCGCSRPTATSSRPSPAPRRARRRDRHRVRSRGNG